MKLWGLLTGLCWWSITVGAAPEIGVVTDVVGELELIRNSAVFRAEEGLSLRREDVLHTGFESETQIEMTDGSVLELGPDSELYLADYRIDANGAVGSAAVGIFSGWLRFLTGRLARGADYEYLTTTATIGIRGTAGIINVDEDETRLLLDDGEVDVAETDEPGAGGAIIRVRAGEYLIRRKGQRARRLPRAQDAFVARLPDRYRRRVARKLIHLQGRRVIPRKLREASYDDVKRLLRGNPKLRKRLQQRFRKRLQDPEFREKLKRNLNKHPEWRKQLKKAVERQRKGRAQRRKRNAERGDL